MTHAPAGLTCDVVQVNLVAPIIMVAALAREVLPVSHLTHVLNGVEPRRPSAQADVFAMKSRVEALCPGILSGRLRVVPFGTGPADDVTAAGAGRCRAARRADD